jgi:hypothetical protein
MTALVILGFGGLACFGSDNHKAPTGPLSATLVEDLDGKPVDPFAASDAKAFVFIFVSVECPISNSYAPEYNRLGAEFGAKHVAVRLVYPNPDETPDRVKKHIKDYALSLVAFRDPAHALAKACGAVMTPEAAVYMPGSGFVYCGRVDNRYADLGVARPAATMHDLRDAITAVLEGRPVARKTAPAVGCSISPRL